MAGRPAYVKGLHDEESAYKETLFWDGARHRNLAFLMGDIELDGERRFRIRAESEKGHLFDFCYPGGIVESFPMYGRYTAMNGYHVFS